MKLYTMTMFGAAAFLGMTNAAGLVAAENNTPIIIPAVKNWKQTEGQTILSGKVYSGKLPSAFNATAEYLKQSLKNETGLDISGEMFFFTEPGTAEGYLVFSEDQNLPEEGYRIVINGRVEIFASNPKGLIWGVRTLQQMLEKNKSLPNGVIEEAPSYEVRSVMIDTGRKFFPLSVLKEWIRVCSRFKINEIHLHLNDNIWGGSSAYRLPSERFSDLPAEDHYTAEEVKEMQDFAALNGVRIVPEIDTPGHSGAFTKIKPELAHPKLGAEYLDINNPGTYKLIEQVLDESAPMFNSEYFHIGTDEYRLGGIPSKEERTATGEKFRQYINHIADYLKTNHGKTVRMWSGFEYMPGTTLPSKDIIIDMWETSDAKTKSEQGYKFINCSHGKTYIVPGAPYYGVSNGYLYEKWTPRVFDKEILPDTAPGVMGGKLHIWNDCGPTGYTHTEIAKLAFPSMASISNGLWGSRQFNTYGEFEKNAKELWEKIPGITINTIEIPANKNGLIWKLDNEQWIVPATEIPLNVEAKANCETLAENLEYPWTAHFVINRTKNSARESRGFGAPIFETLINSSLGGIYLNLEVVTDEKTGAKRRGVGFIRAQRMPASDPLTAFDTRNYVFKYELKPGEDTLLTFVGDRRSTKLYVNGKLVDSTGIQMICPLSRIGNNSSVVPSGFQGQLKKAEIYNRIFTDKEIENFAAQK